VQAVSDRETGENRTPYIDRGEPLPKSYGENSIVAMVREPDMIYVYWDTATEVRVTGSRLLLRAHCVTEGTASDAEPGNGADNMYFHVTPNREYRFELYGRQRSGALQLLACSETVVTPVLRPDDFEARAPLEVLYAERRPMTRQATPSPPRSEPVVQEAETTPAPSPAPEPATDEVRGPFYQSGSDA